MSFSLLLDMIDAVVPIATIVIVDAVVIVVSVAG